ncbi:MAG: PspA/IM30 family protein, partial [Gammaproteobacteria bacterium]
RLFRADLNDLLDRIEEPAVVLKQAVRDMQKELEVEEHAIARLQRENERLAARHEEIEASSREIEARLDLCFESDKEDLARRLIKRRLELQSLDRQLLRKKTRLEEALVQRRTRFQENQARLAEIRQKAELLAEEEADESSGEEPEFCSAAIIRDEDVEVAFLREKQIRSRP